MTLPDTDRVRYQLSRPIVRELLALAMIIVGLVGLITIAASYDWRLAAGVVCLALISIGLTVGIER